MFVRGRSTVVAIYGRRVRGHVIEGPWADALCDLVGRKLTLVSQASLRPIDGDGRRFRMLLEVDGLEA